jgi:hypothetical protein
MVIKYIRASAPGVGTNFIGKSGIQILWPKNAFTVNLALDLKQRPEDFIYIFSANPAVEWDREYRVYLKEHR